jgi:hypothetical protein
LKCLFQDLQEYIGAKTKHLLTPKQYGNNYVDDCSFLDNSWHSFDFRLVADSLYRLLILWLADDKQLHRRDKEERIMSIIDKAFNRQMHDFKTSVAAEVIKLEKEIREAQKGMKETWIELCKGLGVSPEEFRVTPVLEIPDELLDISELCLSYTRIFAEKLNTYKKICRKNGITPNPKIVKKERREVQENNERDTSNDRESDVAITSSRKRQPGRGDDKRVPRRRPKKQRRNR